MNNDTGRQMMFRILLEARFINILLFLFLFFFYFLFFFAICFLLFPISLRFPSLVFLLRIPYLRVVCYSQFISLYEG